MRFLRSVAIASMLVLGGCDSESGPIPPDAGDAGPDAPPAQDPPTRHPVQVEVTGIDGVARIALDEIEEIVLHEDGAHRFAAELAEGEAYTLRLREAPGWQACALEPAEGVAGATGSHELVCEPTEHTLVLETYLKPEYPEEGGGDLDRQAFAMHDGWLAVSQWGEDDAETSDLHLYRRTNRGWVHDREVPLPDSVDFHDFGRAIDLSERHLVVGAPDGTGAGVSTVYVFERDVDGTLTLDAELTAPVDEDATFGGFGEVVLLEGDILVVGGELSETAFYRHDDEDGWVHFDTLQFFGELQGVTLSATHIAFGGSWWITDDGCEAIEGASTAADATYVFRWDEAGATLEDCIADADPEEGEGRTVALDGEWLATSEPAADTWLTLYHREEGRWREAQRIASPRLVPGGPSPLAFTKGVLIAGDPGDWAACDDERCMPRAVDDPIPELVRIVDDAQAGSAYSFTFAQDAGWTLHSYLTAPDADEGDRFGREVATDGRSVAVLAPLEDGDGSNPGSDAVRDSGAVYVYR